MINPDRYSIDMIRLQCRIEKERVTKYMNRYSTSPAVDYWQKFNISSYNHNWRIKDLNSNDEQCSFYAGCSHNAKRKEDRNSMRTDFIVEFNPNTCKGSKELDRILSIFSLHNPILKSVDVAVDFYNLNINDVLVHNGSKIKRNTFDLGGDNKTIYIGEEGQNLRVKVYNKAKERSSKGVDVNHEWSRYEITLKPNYPLDKIDLYSISREIPNLTLVSSVEGEGLNSTDKFILKALKQGTGDIKELPYRRRKKLEPYLVNKDKKLIDKDMLLDTIKEYANMLKAEYHLLSDDEREELGYERKGYDPNKDKEVNQDTGEVKKPNSKVIELNNQLKDSPAVKESKKDLSRLRTYKKKAKELRFKSLLTYDNDRTERIKEIKEQLINELLNEKKNIKNKISPFLVCDTELDKLESYYLQMSVEEVDSIINEVENISIKNIS
jgi:hypothetical protein